jgi:hypothetical protein
LLSFSPSFSMSLHLSPFILFIFYLSSISLSVSHFFSTCLPVSFIFWFPISLSLLSYYLGDLERIPTLAVQLSSVPYPNWLTHWYRVFFWAQLQSVPDISYLLATKFLSNNLQATHWRNQQLTS